MADILGRTYISFTRKNILKGYEASGVSPLNRDVFAPAVGSVPMVVPSADQPARVEPGPEPPVAAVTAGAWRIRCR